MSSPEALSISPEPQGITRNEAEQKLAWTGRGFRDYQAAHDVFGMVEDPHYHVRNGLEMVDIARREDFPIEVEALNLRASYGRINPQRYSPDGSISLQGAMISATEGDFDLATDTLHQYNRHSLDPHRRQFEALDGELFVAREMLLAGENPSRVVDEFGATFRAGGYPHPLEELIHLYQKFGINPTDVVASLDGHISATIEKNHWQAASYAKLYLRTGFDDRAMRIVDTVLSSGPADDKYLGSWNDNHDLIIALARAGKIGAAKDVMGIRGREDVATSTKLGLIVVENPSLASGIEHDEKFFLDAIERGNESPMHSIYVFTDAIAGLHALGVSGDRIRALATKFFTNSSKTSLATDYAYSYENLAQQLGKIGLKNQSRTALQMALDTARDYYHPYPHTESFAKPEQYTSVARAAINLNLPEFSDVVSDVLVTLSKNDTAGLDEMDMAMKREDTGKAFDLKDLMVDDIVREQISKGLMSIGIGEIKKGMTKSEFRRLNKRTLNAIARGTNSYATAGVNHFLGVAS